MSEVSTPTADLSSLTLNDFYTKLSERVSTYNAKLLLQSAVYQSGLDNGQTTPLSKEDAKAVCLELIKKGGPAFQVGKALYQQVQ